MVSKQKSKWLLWTVCSILILSPILAACVLPISVVADFLTETLELSNDVFLGLVIEYATLSITFGLGVIVYLQSEKINNLEATQYDMFIGVEDVDYEFDFGNSFAIEKYSETFHVAHIFTTKRKALISHISIGEGKGKPLLIPLTFLTKNQSLITRLVFKGISIVVRERGTNVHDESYSNNGEGIRAILADGSTFTYGFGLIVPEESNIDEVFIRFDIETENQHGQTKMIQSCVQLRRIRKEEEFVLVASYSNTR